MNFEEARKLHKLIGTLEDKLTNYTWDAFTFDDFYQSKDGKLADIEDEEHFVKMGKQIIYIGSLIKELLDNYEKNK